MSKSYNLIVCCLSAGEKSQPAKFDPVAVRKAQIAFTAEWLRHCVLKIGQVNATVFIGFSSVFTLLQQEEVPVNPVIFLVWFRSCLILDCKQASNTLLLSTLFTTPTDPSGQ